MNDRSQGVSDQNSAEQRSLAADCECERGMNEEDKIGSMGPRLSKASA